MSGWRHAMRELLSRQLPPEPETPAAARTQAALPAPGGDAATAAPDMAALVAQMRIAARQAGIDDDGPLTPLLQAIMLTLERLGTLTDRNARITTEHATALATTLRDARQSADAETQRFYTSLEAAKANTIRDIAHHIARSADAALTRRVRVFDRNTALIAAAVLVGSILAACAGGYWWGNSSALATIHETEWRLQAAFRQGEQGASLWAALMEWNQDILGAIRQCSGAATAITGVYAQTVGIVRCPYISECYTQNPGSRHRHPAINPSRNH